MKKRVREYEITTGVCWIRSSSTSASKRARNQTVTPESSAVNKRLAQDALETAVGSYYPPFPCSSTRSLSRGGS